MAFYPLNGPHKEIFYSPNAGVSHKVYADCPNCRGRCYKFKLVTVTHTVTRLALFFPYYDTVERDGFEWVCPTCGTNFTTPTFDYKTIKPL